jgi:hypothetical protein
MTMSSKSVNVCLRIDSIVDATYRSVLYTGTTTDTAGEDAMVYAGMQNDECRIECEEDG